MSEVIVTKNVESGRYEAHIDAAVAGFLEYEIDGAEITFTHTEVSPVFGGKGIAGKLVKFALEDVRNNEEKRSVIPQCSFVDDWINKHPDYQDLLSNK